MTYQQLLMAADAIKRHDKAHGDIFIAVYDNKLDKIAIFRRSYGDRYERLPDGSKRYTLIGGKEAIQNHLEALAA